MTRQTQIHPNHEQVLEVVRLIHLDKKPRLREILVQKENSRKEILRTAEAHKSKAENVVKLNRGHRLILQEKISGTTRPKQTRSTKKQAINFAIDTARARSFNIR